MIDIACKICEVRTDHIFTGLALKRYKANYHSCRNCGYLFIDKPHWLEEAYSEAIAGADTGLVYRNNLFSECISRYLILMKMTKSKHLDLSGGTGLFTRLMRDNGFDYYWSDPYCKNIHARGFEFSQLPSSGAVQVVTAFEVMEHLEDPLKFIADAFSYPGAEVLIVSTEIFKGHPPSLDSWHYYMPETGQHIGFFQRKTLAYMAVRLDLQLDSYKNFHVFSRKSLPRWPLRLAQLRPNPISITILRKILGSRIMSDHQNLLVR